MQVKNLELKTELIRQIYKDFMYFYDELMGDDSLFELLKNISEKPIEMCLNKEEVCGRLNDGYNLLFSIYGDVNAFRDYIFENKDINKLERFDGYKFVLSVDDYCFREFKASGMLSYEDVKNESIEERLRFLRIFAGQARTGFFRVRNHTDEKMDNYAKAFINSNDRYKSFVSNFNINWCKSVELLYFVYRSVINLFVDVANDLAEESFFNIEKLIK